MLQLLDSFNKNSLTQHYRFPAQSQVYQHSILFKSYLKLLTTGKHTALYKPNLLEPSLDNEFVWDWSNGFWLFSEESDGVSFTWLLVDSLDIDVGASFLGILDGGVVGNNTVEETLTRLGVLDVFNADIDTFWDDTSTNLNSK